MKTIKLKFVDLWRDHHIEETLWYRAFEQAGYSVELSDEPDYLFYSVFGHEHLRPIYDNCIKIARYAEVSTPDFNLCDYAVGMDQIQSRDRFQYFPPFLYGEPDRDYITMEQVLNKGKDIQNDLASKHEFCSFVYSNGNSADPIREQSFRAISQYELVRSGGRFLNNIGLPDGVKDKHAFQSEHKFSIAYENASYPGYTTEKLLEAFAAHTVPIYWGDPLVKNIFNEKAFICAHDYPNMEALIQRIREVDEDDTLYAQMLSEPAFLHPEENSVDLWYGRYTAFIKHILDQSKEEAFRRPRYAYGKYYLQEMRHAFYPTPVKDAGKVMIQHLKKIVPINIKRRIKNYISERK